MTRKIRLPMMTARSACAGSWPHKPKVAEIPDGHCLVNGKVYPIGDGGVVTLAESYAGAGKPGKIARGSTVFQAQKP